MKNLTLKELFENWENLDNRDNFRIIREGGNTTIEGQYNTKNNFYFEVTTGYFNKLSQGFLGYKIKPEKIYK